MRLDRVVQIDKPTSSSSSSSNASDGPESSDGPASDDDGAMACPACATRYALDGRPPRYYCPDCGGRLEVADVD